MFLGRSLKWLKFACLIVVLASSVDAFAKPSFWDRFNLFYKPAPGSEIAKAECNTCHDHGPPVRNPYGRRVGSLINHDNDGTPNGGVTVDDMIFVENEDSDGDGYTNLEEIVSGTLPGDPNSHPTSHPKNLPKHVMSRKFDPMHLKITGGLLAAGALLGLGGKAAKKTYMSRLGLGAGILGVIAVAGTMVAWFFSYRHP